MTDMANEMHRIKITILPPIGDPIERKVQRSDRQDTIRQAVKYADELQRQSPECKISFGVLEGRSLSWSDIQLTPEEIELLSN